MGVNVRISRAAFDRIVAQAHGASGEECCGLLLANPSSPAGHIDSILPAANVSANRRSRFEIDPAVLIAAHRAERAGGPRILGCYHSHPGGNPVPSAEDAIQAEANGALWLICAGPPWTASLWTAVTGGSVQGRFHPVPMIVADDPENTP